MRRNPRPFQIAVATACALLATPVRVLPLLLPAVLAGPLRAAENTDARAMQKQLFGRPVGPSKAYACFRRGYDGVHLSRHPRQNVRTMALLVTAQPGTGPDDPEATYQLVLDVTFRREAKHFETEGDCRSLFVAGAGSTPATPAQCGVACDGGSIDVASKDANTVMVGIPERARIWQAGTDPEDETGPYHKRFGADDKLFRLERAALADCVALVDDPKDKAALRLGHRGRGR